MKNYLPYICSLILISLFLTSCQKRESLPAEMIVAESIMRSRPDSALTILESMPIPNPSDERIYATYCLLLVQARDKNYIEHTSDSLVSIPLNYFMKHGPEDRKMWALYYGGRVNSDLFKTAEAAFCYLEAKRMADYTTDYSLRMRLNLNLALLYRQMGLFDESLKLIEETLACNREENDISAYIYSFRDMGWIYECLKDYDSALTAYQHAFEYMEISNDTVANLLIHEGIANLYLMMEKYDDLISYIRDNITLNQVNYYATHSLLGNAYFHLHQYDSSAYYFNILKESNHIYNKASSFKYLAKIERSQREYDKAFEYSDLYINCIDTVEAFTLSESIAELTAIYEKERLQNNQVVVYLEKSNQQITFVLVLTVLLFIALLVYVYYFFLNRKRENYILKAKRDIYIQRQKIWENERIIAQNLQLLQQKGIELIGNRELEQENLRLQKQNRVFIKQIGEKEQLYSEFLNKHTIVYLETHKELSEQIEYLRRSTDLLIDYIIKKNPLLSRFKDGIEKKTKFSPEELDKIMIAINKLYNGLIDRLKVDYPILTTEDILVCGLLKIRLKTRQIAVATSNTTNNIYKRKQRICEKIGLRDTRSLEDFLCELEYK